MGVKAFARKAKKYVAEKDFYHQANQSLKLYNLTMRVNRLELLKSNIGLELTSVFDDLDKFFSNQLTDTALAGFDRQAGILGLSVHKNGYDSLVETVLKGSYHVENFPSFSDKLWQYQIELKADIEKLLIRSITGGINPKELAPQLKRLMTEKGKLNATYNAQRLLVSETTRIQTAVQAESYKKANIDDYEFVAEPSACPSCGALNGEIFKLTDMSPGINAPNMHPFCRCSTVPYVDDKKLWDNLLDRKVISEGEYKQAFDDRDEADKAIDKLNEQKETLKVYNKFSKAFGGKGLPSLEEFGKIRYNKGSEWDKLKGNYFVNSRLNDGRYGSIINPEKQAVHMKSTAIKGRSYFNDK